MPHPDPCPGSLTTRGPAATGPAGWSRAVADLLRLGVVGCVLLGGACSPAPRLETFGQELRLEQPPSDFALAVSVFAAEPNPGSLRPVPRSRRDARYQFEPDGVLRAALGPGATPDYFPPQTRRLTPAQLQRLWKLTQDAGVHEPGAPFTPGGRTSGFRPASTPAALFEVNARGQRTAYVIPLDDTPDPNGQPGPNGPGALSAPERLIDELAELSWIDS